MSIWRLYGLFKELALSKPVWNDLRFPSTAFNPPGQISDPTWDPTNIGWIMENLNVLYVIAQFSHQKELGTSIYPHIHWEQTEAGLVHWRMEYQWYNNGDVEATEYTTIDTTTQLFPYTSGRLAQISVFPDIEAIADEEVSSFLKIRLLRIDDASDTYVGDPLLSEFDIHFQIDTMGSEEEFAK